MSLIQRLRDYDNCDDNDIDLAADMLEQASEIIRELVNESEWCVIDVDEGLITRAKKWLEGGE